MTDEAKRILEAALRLPEAERAALAAMLEDSIRGESCSEIDAAWLDEAERRREEVRSGRAQLVPWRDVRREMFEMLERARLDKSERERQATG